MKHGITSVLILALCATYLEWQAPTQSPALKSGYTGKVVRSSVKQPPVVATTIINEAPTTAPILSLALPQSEAPRQQFSASSQPQANRFKAYWQANEPDLHKIRYGAELIFDREKGEDITGGKLNIKIPLG